MHWTENCKARTLILWLYGEDSMIYMNKLNLCLKINVNGLFEVFPIVWPLADDKVVMDLIRENL